MKLAQINENRAPILCVLLAMFGVFSSDPHMKMTAVTGAIVIFAFM